MFEFLLFIGALLAFYGYNVAKNPRVWGDQGKGSIQEKNWKGYAVRNGQFFMYSGLLLIALSALDIIFDFSTPVYLLILLGGEGVLYYPLGQWMKQHENTWWAWPKRDKKKDKKKTTPEKK